MNFMCVCNKTFSWNDVLSISSSLVLESMNQKNNRTKRVLVIFFPSYMHVLHVFPKKLLLPNHSVFIR